MAQGLPPQRAARGSDRDHVTSPGAGLNRLWVGIFFLALTLLALLAGTANAQSRGQVQVAARVVSAEPSRQALALAIHVPRTGTRPTWSSLARVQVLRERPERRVIAIDFLRN